MAWDTSWETWQEGYSVIDWWKKVHGNCPDFVRYFTVGQSNCSWDQPLVTVLFKIPIWSLCKFTLLFHLRLSPTFVHLFEHVHSGWVICVGNALLAKWIPIQERSRACTLTTLGEYNHLQRRGTLFTRIKGPGTLKTGTIFAKPSTNRALSKVWFKDICNRCPFEVWVTLIVALEAFVVRKQVDI